MKIAGYDLLWNTGKLGDFLTLKRGYDLPKGRRSGGVIPVVSSSGVSDYHSVAMAKGPGVVTGRYGTIGEVFYIDCPFWPLNTALYVSDFKGNDPRFVSYLLRTLDFLAYSDKGAVPGINRNHLHEALITFPVSVDEQRAIASILGALDDKIEVNRKMSATLEAIARALFKSWFVDFDPVRAKAEGRDPGLPAEIAALFPDSFEETAHGQIPSGWRVGTLGDLISQRADRCDESEETASKPYVPIDCIGSKSLLLDAVKPGYEAKSSLTRFYKDDILFGAMRPYFHKVCVAPFDGITRTTVFTLYPRERADFAFVTLLLHDDRTIDYATAHSTGTTIPYAVWRNSLERMQTVIPPPRLRETFGEVVGPALQRIAEVFSESRTLAALRDALLPKLISGELRVGDAERVLAASA